MTQEKQTTAIQAINPDGVCNAIQAVLVAAQTGQEDSMTVCSYDSNTVEGCKRRERHECDVDDNGKVWINKPLDIVAWTMKKTMLPDATGELRWVPVLTLEMKGGELVNLFSPSAVKVFVSRLRTHLMEGPLDSRRPLKLMLTQKQGEGAKMYYWLDRQK